MLTNLYIKRLAAEAGFTLCGVARARVLEEHRVPFEAALAASGGGALPYLARGFERRLDPSSVLPGARSVVVCALAYPFHAPDGSGVASYARLPEDYHVRIKRMLRVVADLLRSPQSPRLVAACDTAPILEKAWAVEAGLGWQGRNSLIINPLHGSFLLLGEIVLDAEVDVYDEPFTGGGCGSCRACVDACPVGAIAGGTVDTNACISSLTNELPRLTGTAPERIHGWIRGCDICQAVCPQNAHSLRNAVQTE